ncbi:MAG: nucleotidyltransferase/DNA polymerase involved in repair [Myxococcaceae bacterium]|nr:nucleotidyltransferase/DNA polymerase involved in repair [Myxococcaceae bacterium]
MSLRRLACIDVPDLPLQMLLREHPEYRALPVAVVAEERPEAELLLINGHARALRLSTGMRFGAAKSLVPELRAGAVSAVELEEMAAQLVRDLQTFSPHVERDPVHAGVFYVDPTGLSHLYGGEASWARCLQRYLIAKHFHASVVVAYGRALSYALVRASHGARGASVRVFDSAEASLEAAREVTFERLAMQPKLRTALERLGLSTLGDLTHFGADQLALRFGPKLGPEAARWCAVARGQEVLPLCPEPHVDTPRTEVEIEPPDHDVGRLCFAIKQALDALIEDVRKRGVSVRALWMRLLLERGGENVQRLEPSASTRNGPLLLELLRLRLTALTLSDSVARVVLEAELSETGAGQLAMFGPKRDVAAGDRALARLKASYGADVVCRAVLEDAHLPEAKYRWTDLSHIELPREQEARSDGGGSEFELESMAPLPLVRRVLLKPEPISGKLEVDPSSGALSLRHANEQLALSGPYRVSGGWWVREVARDYYYARTLAGSLLWIFFDLPRNAWFLHATVD